MKRKYGKRIDPRKFQQSVLADLKEHVKQTGKRAKDYSKRATVKVERCYVCGSGESKQVISVYGFDYVECNECGQVYATRRLSQLVLDKYYRESDYAKTYTSGDQIGYRLEKIGRPKVEFVMEYAAKKGRWLDVGSAIGDIVKAVDEYPGWEATGIEISKEAVKVGKREFGVDLLHGTFQNYVKKNSKSKFGVVSFFGYLELVSEPMKELELATRLVEKNGLVVVGEINSKSMSMMMQQAFPELSNRNLLPPVVLHLFNEKSLMKAMRLVGLEPVAVWYFGLDYYEMLKMVALKLPEFADSTAFKFMMDNLNELQKVVDKKKKADNFVMIGRK